MHKVVTQWHAADVGGLYFQRPDVLSQTAQVAHHFKVSAADSMELTWARDGAIWHCVHPEGIVPKEVCQILALLMSHLQGT